MINLHPTSCQNRMFPAKSKYLQHPCNESLSTRGNPCLEQTCLLNPGLHSKRSKWKHPTDRLSPQGSPPEHVGSRRLTTWTRGLAWTQRHSSIALGRSSVALAQKRTVLDAAPKRSGCQSWKWKRNSGNKSCKKIQGKQVKNEKSYS